MRSSNLVRSRLPTSDEISQPLLAYARCWHRARGGAAGIRTPDLRRARAALSRLSYGPPSRCPRPPPPSGVGAPGLEPGTSALSGPRSNRLSYAPAAGAHVRDTAPLRPQRRMDPGVPVGSLGWPVAPCPRRSARTLVPAQQLRSSRTHVAPPTSPPSVAPLPGPTTVSRRERLGARCPPMPDHHSAA